MGDLKNFSKLQVNTRSSHPEVFCKKMFLKILQISQKNIFVGVPFLIKLQAGNLKLSETATEDVLLRKVFLKRRTGVHTAANQQPFIHHLHKMGVFEQFTKFTAKNLCWSLLLVKLQFGGPATLLKKTSNQVLSLEIYKLFKNNYFEKHL